MLRCMDPIDPCERDLSIDCLLRPFTKRNLRQIDPVFVRMTINGGFSG